MKTRFLAVILCAVLAPWVWAADSLIDLTRGSEGAQGIAPLKLEQGHLEILLAPIALYPDALVALILPAATRPSDIVLASRFLKAGGSEADIDAQPWSESVKALARFPEVIRFLDENLAWTQEVGDAFVAQPAEVMGAVQALRARATRNGLLASTPQQEVLFEEDDTIRIIPAEREVIYVPNYDPSYLYHTQSYTYYPSSLVWFGVGYGIGSWLSYDCDWRRRTVWVHHNHHNRWNRDHDWRKRYTTSWSAHVGGTDWKRWDPSPSHRRHHPRSGSEYGRLETQRNGSYSRPARPHDEPRRDITTVDSRPSRNLQRPDRSLGRTTPDLNSRPQPTRPVETVSAPKNERTSPPSERRGALPNRRIAGETIERPREVASPVSRNRQSQRPAEARAIVPLSKPAAVGPAVRSRPATEMAAPRQQVRSSPQPQVVTRNDSPRNSSPPPRRESRDTSLQSEEN